MPSVFDLLEDIEKRPGLFLGWSDAERDAQLRDLEVLLMGYGHAVTRHGIDDPGGHFLQAFSRFLRDSHGWSDERGPIVAIREVSANAEDAWNQLWVLIGEFREELER